MALWVARAGKFGEQEDFALQNNVAVTGWDDLLDLSRFQTKNDLSRFVSTTYPDEKAGTRRNWVSQLWTFSTQIRIGDLIALPSKHRAVIAFGEVSGNYEYIPDNPAGARHVHRVRGWTELPRNAFRQDLLYSFNGASTVFGVKRNHAEERVKKVLAGGIDAGTTEGPLLIPTTDGEESVDLEQVARDRISAYIDQKFKGHGTARLVGAILQAQGYRVRVSPEGPDGGVDIIAGRGLLGFEPPRLVVQVKSTSGPIDVSVLRELQGILSNFNAEQGLIVATGGYKTSVEKEAARQFFKIRLWDADDLVQMLEDHYDQLPEAIKAEIPLKRVWMLVGDDE